MIPRQGASSGFKFGRGCGALEATIQLLELPMTIVEPTAWKKFYQLRGGDREASRQRALQLFPAAHALLARRKDHGRAEAALIALAGVPMALKSENEKALADRERLTRMWRRYHAEQLEKRSLES